MMKKKRITAAMILLLLLSGCSPKAKFKKQEESSSIVPYIDADAYYAEMGEIKQKISVNKSGKMLTEKEISESFKERGFEAAQIQTEYSIDGTYSPASEISEDSDERHPLYHAVYQSETGIFWNISVIEDVYLAEPFSFNLEAQKAVVVSETDSITGYDSATNQFYVVKPNGNDFQLITLKAINKKTLDVIGKEDLIR